MSEQQFTINPDLVESLEKLIHSNLIIAAKKFSDMYDLNEKEVIKTCIPTLNIKQDLESHNHKLEILDKISTKQQLEKMKVIDIKYYLQHYELKISGKKQVLVDRLWNYILENKDNFSDETPESLVKKTKKKCYHIVDMSETEEIGNYYDIYLDSNRPLSNVVNKTSGIGTKYYLDAETNYVSEMNEEDNQLYYVGYLSEDGKTVDFQHEIEI